MNEITRVVRLSFEPNKITEFVELFNQSKPVISNFDGCLDVSLYQDHDYPNVMYTLSKWQSIESLEAYRQSDFFKITWRKTKMLFNDSPKAFSLKSFTQLS